MAIELRLRREAHPPFVRQSGRLSVRGVRVEDADLDVIVGWLAEVGPRTDPLPEKLIPGASPRERATLAALGGVVGELVGEHRTERWRVDSDLSILWRGAESPPAQISRAAKRLIASRGDAGFAALYSRIVRPENRRLLGTFFTPQQEVDWMIDRWAATEHAPSTVIDVGAGVGVFTTAAATRWHGAQVWAVDVNPATLGLLAARVAGRYRVVPSGALGAGVRLVCEDYLHWLERTWELLPRGRLVLGNPPYTRSQLIPAEDRHRIMQSAGGLCGSHASLSSLITAATLRRLQPEDGLCLLLPAQWLESSYAEPLRRHLWALRNRRIELRLFSADLFPDALVDAVALMVGTERRDPQVLVITSTSGLKRTLSRRQPCPANWRALFHKRTPSSRTIAAGALHVRDLAVVRRGAATGDNSFFAISEARRRELGLPRSLVTPLARRLRDFANVIDTPALNALDPNVPRWLLTIKTEQRVQSQALDDYLSRGERLEVHRRRLCAKRRCWFELGSELFIPDVILGPMSQAAFPVILNASGAAITNNVYGLRWRPEVTQASQAGLVSWLRSAEGQAAMRAAAREQARGLLKLEPRAVADIEIPDNLAVGRFKSPEADLR